MSIPTEPQLEIPPQPVPPPPAPPRPNRLPGLTFLLFALILILAFPFVAERVQYALTRGHEAARADVAKELLADLPAAEFRAAYAAKAVEPSVVAIKTEQVQRASANDERSQLYGQRRLEGEGSGVIVGSDGFILTNFHVINNADQIEVHLSDGRTIGSVRVVGADPFSDLAVLKIEASNLTEVLWGDSDALNVGDAVLAVGNPFGLTHTFTAGIISAKQRQTEFGRMLHHEFLQTDAAVNPGNSGGPLVNMRGELVGINTAIYGEVYQGISFAIPSLTAKEVYERLKNDGEIAWGWFGVSMGSTADLEVVQNFNIAVEYGSIVLEVISGSPAATAGIKPGDVVIEWDGQRIEEPRDLSEAVVRTLAGEKVDVVILRGGEQQTIPVVVGERPLLAR